MVAALAVLASCGTRLPDSAFVGTATDQAGTATTAGGAVDAGGQLPTGADGATATTLGAGPGATTPAGGPAVTTAGGTKQPTGGSTTASGPNQASDIGISTNSITLGNITAENGVLGDAFAPAVQGIRAWVQHINAKGGINGRTIILKTCDDREDRNRALECARRLVEQDKVFALVATNTRALGGASQYLNDKGVPVLGIPINNAFARYPHFWSAYPNGYHRDGKTVGHNGQIMSTSGPSRWFKQKLGVDNAAVFSYDIDESRQAGAFIVKGLELEGFKVTSYSVSFAAPSFDQAVADMERQGTQIVFDAMDDGANRKLCDAMARRNFKPKAKVSTIVSFRESVKDNYNDACRNALYIVGDSIPFTATKVPAVKEFREAFARYQPGRALHQWALEAWAMGTLVGEIVKGMGPAPTRAGLEKGFAGLRGYKGNGIYVGLDWVPADYSKTVVEDCFAVARFSDAAGGWTEASEPFPFCYPDGKQYGTPALEQGN